jgi:predicted small lipoprotein YifL
MHTRLTAAAIAATLALAVTACGVGHPHHMSPSASAAASADARQGERILAGCLQHNTTIRAIARCVVPKGSGRRAELCAIRALGHGNPLTAAGREADDAPLGKCLTSSR